MSMDQGKRNKCIVLLMLMLYVTETQAVGVYHLCGIQLVDTLLMVCEGKGLYYRTSKGRPHGNFASRNKKKIGIVEKCCHYTCSFNDLQAYCKS